VAAKVTERLAVSEHTSHRFHMERFNLKKLNEAESKEQCCVEVSNRFAALEDLDAKVYNNNNDRGTIINNISISAKKSLGYHKMKKHKPWFGQGRSELMDQRKRSRFQSLLDLCETN
jgi:hypothetical protein